MKLQVDADDSFVVLQVLLDCLTEDDITQYVRVIIKGANGRFVAPLLPTKFEQDMNYEYHHQGYMYNLAKGDYTVMLASKTESESLGLKCDDRVVDGRKWMIRAVSENVSLQKMN